MQKKNPAGANAKAPEKAKSSGKILQIGADLEGTYKVSFVIYGLSVSRTKC